MRFIEQLRWRPEIGDPSPMGWLTVAAYAVAAFTAWHAARRAGRVPGIVGGSRGTWILVTMLMTVLCLNTQLDLQSLATDVGRVISLYQGWFLERPELRKWFVLGALSVSLLTAVVLLIRFRQFWKKHLLLSTGLLVLLTFFVVRTIPFHQADRLLGSEIAGVKTDRLIELTGITLIWLAAYLDYRNPMRAPKPPWKPAS